MKISRRTLLKTGAVCAAGAVFPAAAYAGLIDQERPVNLAQFSLVTFRPCLDDTFKVSHQGRKIPLKLVETRDLTNAFGPGGGECFSLLFESCAKAPLRQGTYRIRHPGLGTFAMFLVPVNQPVPDGAVHYEALFNRRPRSA